MEQKSFIGVDALVFHLQPQSMQRIIFAEKRNEAGNIVFQLSPYRQRFVRLTIVLPHWIRPDNVEPFNTHETAFLRDIVPALRRFLKNSNVPTLGLRICSLEVNKTFDLSRLKGFEEEQAARQTSQLLEFMSCALLAEVDAGSSHFVGVRNDMGLVNKEVQSVLLKKERAYALKLYNKSIQMGRSDHLLRFEIILLRRELDKLFERGDFVEVLSAQGINKACQRFAKLTLDEIIPSVKRYQSKLGKAFVRLARKNGVTEAFALLVGNGVEIDESGAKYAISRFYGTGGKANAFNMLKFVMRKFGFCPIVEPFFVSLRRACKDLIG